MCRLTRGGPPHAGDRESVRRSTDRVAWRGRLDVRLPGFPHVGHFDDHVRTYGGGPPEIGHAVAGEGAPAVLARFAEYAHDRLNPYEVACALEDFGLAVSVHADDIDYLEEGYAYLLRKAAALTGGAITVADVRLREGEFVSGSRDDVLEFERNGELISISAERYSDEYYDHLAACDDIDHLSPDDDPRSFRLVDFEREEHRHYDSILVLAAPEQTEAMRKHFGLEFH